MNEPLSQLSQFTNQQTQINTSEVKPKLIMRLPRVQELIGVNSHEIEFGMCIISTVHQRKIALILKDNHDQPKIITLTISCQDQLLKDKSQMIFGIRKQSPLQYFPQFKFKASQKGLYSFIVGVKTPNLNNYLVKFKLLIKMEGVQGILSVNLSQTTVIPQIKCSKQLVNLDDIRVIKLGLIKDKNRKDIKVSFKNLQNLNFALFTELIGSESQQRGQVQVKPKFVQVKAKAMFSLFFSTTFPNQLNEGWMCVRRLLLLRIKNTNIYFHFALEVTFYPESKRREPSVQ